MEHKTGLVQWFEHIVVIKMSSNNITMNDVFFVWFCHSSARSEVNQKGGVTVPWGESPRYAWLGKLCIINLCKVTGVYPWTYCCMFTCQLNTQQNRYPHGIKISGSMLQKHLQIGHCTKFLSGPYVNVSKYVFVSPHLNHEGIYIIKIIFHWCSMLPWQDIYDEIGWASMRILVMSFGSLPDRSKWPKTLVTGCHLGYFMIWVESEHMMHGQPYIQPKKHCEVEQPSWFSSVMCCFQTSRTFFIIYSVYSTSIQNISDTLYGWKHHSQLIHYGATGS